jgi:hypothetical protein
MKRNILFLLFFCLCTAMISHKFYMSLTQINYSEEKQTLQIIVRVFIDDLETEINTLSQHKIELGTDRELLNIDHIYKNYLNSHLHFHIDKHPKTFKYIGNEYKNDQVFFYLEVAEIDSIQSLEIQNTMLHNSFQEQENIVKTSIYDKHKSFILTRNNSKAFLNTKK